MQSTGSTGIPEATHPKETPIPEEIGESVGNDMIKISIAVGDSTFSAALFNNETSRALVEYFPMTVQMNELNGQEKYYDLPAKLKSSTSERPSTIHSGDIMCWSGNCLVLFYKTYSNSYGGYVPLGAVDDPSGLAKALGSGNMEVTWSLAK
jgi:hypothetical protein